MRLIFKSLFVSLKSSYLCLKLLHFLHDLNQLIFIELILFSQCKVLFLELLYLFKKPLHLGLMIKELTIFFL